MQILKSTLLTSCICLVSFFSWSQTVIDTSFRHQMNTIFTNVDKSKVPQGILRDYAMEFTNLGFFNGTAALADSNYAQESTFWSVYHTLISGRIHGSATGFVHGDSIDNRWYNQQQTGQITLCGLYFLYSRFKNNAHPDFITLCRPVLYLPKTEGRCHNEQPRIFSNIATNYKPIALLSIDNNLTLFV